VNSPGGKFKNKGRGEGGVWGRGRGPSKPRKKNKGGKRRGTGMPEGEKKTGKVVQC